MFFFQNTIKYKVIEKTRDEEQSKLTLEGPNLLQKIQNISLLFGQRWFLWASPARKEDTEATADVGKDQHIEWTSAL